MHRSLHDSLTFDVQQLKDLILASLMAVKNHKLHIEALQSLSNNLQWLNPATCFSSTKWGFFRIANVIIITVFLLMIVCKTGINALSTARDEKHIYTAQLSQELLAAAFKKKKGELSRAVLHVCVLCIGAPW